MIKDAPKLELYDNKSGPVLYRSWKAALEREVSHLSLNAAQWLEVLKVRAKGEALKVVQDTTNLLMPESTPESTLKITWEFLNERFLTSLQPSQEILNTIVNGPRITLKDVAQLTNFAQACASAQSLKDSGSNTLSPLDHQTTQETVFDRLDDELNREWYKYRLANGLHEDPVPFKHFVDWIRYQSKVELGRRKQDAKAIRTASSTPSAASQITTPVTTNAAPLQTNTRTALPQSQNAGSREKVRCVICRVSTHHTYACETLSESWFQSLSAGDQREKVRGACFTCLGELKHPMGRDECPVRQSCDDCRQKHHLKLHCNPPKRNSSSSAWGRDRPSSNNRNQAA